MYISRGDARRPLAYTKCHAPVAQLDRAPAFEAGCRRFESCRAHQYLDAPLSFQSSDGVIGVHSNLRHSQQVRFDGCATRRRTVRQRRTGPEGVSGKAANNPAGRTISRMLVQSFRNLESLIETHSNLRHNQQVRFDGCASRRRTVRQRRTGPEGVSGKAANNPAGRTISRMLVQSFRKFESSNEAHSNLRHDQQTRFDGCATRRRTVRQRRTGPEGVSGKAANNPAGRTSI